MLEIENGAELTRPTYNETQWVAGMLSKCRKSFLFSRHHMAINSTQNPQGLREACGSVTEAPLGLPGQRNSIADAGTTEGPCRSGGLAEALRCQGPGLIQDTTWPPRHHCDTEITKQGQMS